MGRKIEALKWAMTTRPKLRISDRIEWAKHEIGYLLMPYRCDASYIIYSAIGGMFALFVISLFLNLPTVFFLALFLLIGYSAFRASIKLGNEWVDENLDITIKWKHKGGEVDV